MSRTSIYIKGAREHNLKNIDLELPRDRLIVVTGLSGSGKSSLAFDTIYAEGQRRYVESLSSYARQFLGQMDKPDVDYIEGLSPAISIDQKGASRNPRSTVGTVTEIYDYLRLLFARIGIPHCPKCGRKISTQTVEQMVDHIMALPAGSKIFVLAPLVRGRKGEYHKLFEEIRQKGYTRVRVNGTVYDLDDRIPLERYKKHFIEAVVDRLAVKPDIKGRLADSLETTLRLSGGMALIGVAEGEDHLFSQQLSCPDCGVSFEELQPRLFSFNSPHGACPQCTGIGSRLELDPAMVVPNPGLSIAEGAIAPWGKPIRDFRHHAAESWFWERLGAAAHTHRIDLHTPFKKLSAKQRHLMLHGSGEAVEKGFEGAIPNLERRFQETSSDYIRWEIEKYMSHRPCPACRGSRLKPEALAVTIDGRHISAITNLSVRDALAFFSVLPLTERQRMIARQILKEVQARLSFLADVGLDYLSLDRSAGTLAGGEAQRIRLASQIGSGLVGVLYILDEPSIGLHQRDNRRLLATLTRLRDLGNTVVVVEHDEETIRSADHVVDIGPGAGIHGGRVVAQGTPEEVARVQESITGQYLSGARSIAVPPRRRSPGDQWVEVAGARQHNLKNLTVRLPLGLFTCITGVSGSGKSTLVYDILFKALDQLFYGGSERPGEHDEIRGWEALDKVIPIDQSAIGRTPRSNPATYTGVFDPIRTVFAMTPEAKMRGYQPGRFSFNVKGGRCEACQGQGILEIEMHFLPDVYIPCEVCRGKRYARETLEVHFKGKTIAEVLEMTVDEALAFFKHLPAIKNKLETLADVGLGYIHLGQPATTLSGGEAQRIKLSTELSRRATGKTLYILDEPTTGLHSHDVAKLLEVLQRLVSAGNTVVVIEHNLDVVKSADWIVDLGPEGGELGGEIVAEGPPEQVARLAGSYTGEYLAPLVGVERPKGRSPKRAPNGKAASSAAEKIPVKR